MTFSTTPTFRKLLASLDPLRKIQVVNRIEEFKWAFTTGQIRVGFGIKKLSKELWELRVGLSERILFSKKGDHVIFRFIGNHDEIRRFLKHL